MYSKLFDRRGTYTIYKFSLLCPSLVHILRTATFLELFLIIPWFRWFLWVLFGHIHFFSVYIHPFFFFLVKNQIVLFNFQTESLLKPNPICHLVSFMFFSFFLFFPQIVLLNLKREKGGREKSDGACLTVPWIGSSPFFSYVYFNFFKY